MHGARLHQWEEGDATSAIWLLAGTGEGPKLAQALLEQGWRLLVSVVSPEAARAYSPHPRLNLQVGALADAAAIEATLKQLQPRWVVDATHPFAAQISTLLRQVCTQWHQPLLALARDAVSTNTALKLEPIRALSALASVDLTGERLLLAIGSRHLPAALAARTPAAITPACWIARPACSWPWRQDCRITTWPASAPTPAGQGRWNGRSAAAGASAPCCAASPEGAGRASGSSCAATWDCDWCCWCSRSSQTGLRPCPWRPCWRSWAGPELR